MNKKQMLREVMSMLGKRTSEAKAEAARRNAKLPRKKTVKARSVGSDNAKQGAHPVPKKSGLKRNERQKQAPGKPKPISKSIRSVRE